MGNFKIERIYLLKLQAIAEHHNLTLNTIINQAVEIAIHNYEHEHGVISIDFDNLNDEEMTILEEVLEEALTRLARQQG
jgi:uncharacterized protein YpbB